MLHDWEATPLLNTQTFLRTQENQPGVQDSAKMALGEYPAEYDKRIHGPYDPGRYYGKPDTKFGQVKLGELTAWLGRRNKSPTAIVSAMSRAWWRWQHRYIMPWNAGIGGPMQFLVGTMLFFYVINYPKYRSHRHYKYHW